MPKSNFNQNGIVHLGVLVIAFLALAALVGSNVVSDFDLNFNIAEKAAPPQGEEACKSAGCPWVWRNGECKKTESKCDGQTGASFSPTCSGTCEIGIESCLEKGLRNITGSCNKGICCSSPSSSSGGSGNPTPSPNANINENNPGKIIDLGSDSSTADPTKVPTPTPTPVPTKCSGEKNGQLFIMNSGTSRCIKGGGLNSFYIARCSASGKLEYETVNYCQ